MDETALTSINKILKVLNEQDEEVWRNQAEIKYTRQEADKLNSKTKKLLKKIKQLETENVEVEEENKRIEAIIEQEKCSIEIAKTTNLMLISKQKDNEIYLKSWTDKCDNVIKEHAKNYEKHKEAVKQNCSYLKLKAAENDFLKHKIEYGILKNKLDTMVRISKQKEEMSRKIFTSIVVNFAKTCLDYNKNKNTFKNTKEMEAKYKQLVETYHNIQTKVLQKELELDKKNRVANMNKNFEKISQLGTQDSVFLMQQRQEINTSITSSESVLQSPIQSSVADENVEDGTKISFKSSFADFAKKALIQNSAVFKKPEQRNILGPITASNINQNERILSTGRQQERIKIYNEEPNPNNMIKETFTRKSDGSSNFFLRKSENNDLQNAFLSPKAIRQKNTLKRLSSFEQSSPKRRVLTCDSEQKIKLTETVDGAYLQNTAPSENFSSQKPPENNVMDEDRTLNTAQIFENLIICSQPDESKHKSEMKSSNFIQTKQNTAAINQNNLNKELVKTQTPVKPPENSTETVKNSQEKSVDFQTQQSFFASGQTNQNFILQQSVNTTQKSNEMMMKPDNAKLIQSPTKELEKAFTFERNFTPSYSCRSLFGKNIAVPSVQDTEVTNKRTEKQQETFAGSQSGYPNQKDNEVIMKPSNDKASQSSSKVSEKTYTLEHNFDPFFQNGQPAFTTNLFSHQSQIDSETVMKPDDKKLSQSSAKEPEKTFNLEHNFVSSFMRNITNQNDNNLTLNANNASFNVSLQDPGQLSTFIDERMEESGTYVFPFSPVDDRNNSDIGGNFLF